VHCGNICSPHAASQHAHCDPHKRPAHAQVVTWAGRSGWVDLRGLSAAPSPASFQSSHRARDAPPKASKDPNWARPQKSPRAASVPLPPIIPCPTHPMSDTDSPACQSGRLSARRLPKGSDKAAARAKRLRARRDLRTTADCSSSTERGRRAWFPSKSQAGERGIAGSRCPLVNGLVERVLGIALPRLVSAYFSPLAGSEACCDRASVDEVLRPPGCHGSHWSSNYPRTEA
jgi:hypothetical protein